MQQPALNNIINIINKTNSENINIDHLECKLFTNKYSAKKASIWCLFLNKKQVKKKDPYIFTYKCISCSTIHKVSSTQMLRKINKNIARCYLCRNLDTSKRIDQSEFMKNNNPQNKPTDEEQVCSIIEKINFINIRNASIEMFNNYDDDFKDNYFNNHLTQEEYLKLSKNIKSLGDGKYDNLLNYEYWPIYKSNNQMLFTSIFYDKSTDTIFKAHQPMIYCDNCNTIWRAKSLERFKNNIKIFCKDCSFVNKTFKIRQTKNIKNETICYQSKLELKFITWCNNNNIYLTNGPKIPYIFNNKERLYKVDFQINDTLIEVKDNHVWHKNAIKSGKFKAKMDAVEKINNNFYLLTPTNWSNILNKLIKYSLISYESMRSDSLNTLA
jgi:hypothetical protein